ncbi:hypothetical protein ACWDXD_27975 [Streptomyces sp. NPDC003314]
MSAREERLLTPETIAAVDQWLDDADVFAKGYWQYVDGKLTTVGLRIGEGWNKVVAFFGDTVVRHQDGSHSVLSAKDAAEVSRLREERHSTNEALSDAAETIRAQRDRIAELEALTPAPIQTCQTCGAGYNLGQPCQVCAYRALVATELKRQQEDPHDGPLHQTYTVGRDLPEVTP